MPCHSMQGYREVIDAEEAALFHMACPLLEYLHICVEDQTIEMIPQLQHWSTLHTVRMDLIH